MRNYEQQKIKQEQTVSKKVYEAKIQDNYSMELASITTINNGIIEVEKLIDQCGDKITPQIIDKELRRYFPSKLKQSQQEITKVNEENTKLSKELVEVKLKLEQLELKVSETVNAMHQLAQVFDNKPIAYLAKAVNDFFSGPAEMGLPIAKVQLKLDEQYTED